MTEIPDPKVVILLEQCQENPENFLNELENKNIDYPTLVKYLDSINSLYNNNLEQQKIFEELQSNLDENIQIINKKREVYEDKISGNKQKIDELINESKIDKGKIKGFFERLQESNVQEVSQKKIKFLESEIEELNKVKKKIDQSKDTFLHLENKDQVQKNKNLSIIMTKILKRLETVKLDNLSRNDINIIKQSITLSDSSSPNPSTSSSSFSFLNIPLYLSLSISVVSVLVYFLK